MKNDLAATLAKPRLPVHRRVSDPPPMQLTQRDRQVIQTVYEYRFLRRDQIQALFFSSQNTANRRLQYLFHHGFLKRYLPPVQLGEGRPQAIYSLDERGADQVAIEEGIDRAEVRWRKKDNQAQFFFLDHTLRINDFRIAITMAAKKLGHQVTKWCDEREIKLLGERVPILQKRKGYLPVAPDAFFIYDFGHRQAGFFLEVDMGTMTNKRFKDKVRAYIAYKTEGYYKEKFGTSSLRVLTIVPSYRRLKNLKRATEQAKGRNLFWFTTFTDLSSEKILEPVWSVAGQEGTSSLFW